MSFSRPVGRSGFSLVEIVIALGVVSIALLTLMGLLAVGISDNKATVQQSIAVNIAAAAMADLRSTPLTTQNYTPNEVLYSPRFRFVLPATGTGMQTVYVADDGTPLTTVNPASPNLASNTSTYRVSVLGPLRPAGATQPQRLASPVYILVTWPGQADQNVNQWPSHYAGSFQTVTYLDQN